MKSIVLKIFSIAATGIFFINVLEAARKIDYSTITTVKTIHGDLYKCVDIYEQPSLKHEAFKDPQVKERLHNYLREVVAKTTENIKSRRRGIWINDKGCPSGTVPIQQISKASNGGFYNHSLDWNTDRVEFAGLVAKAVPGTDVDRFIGAMAYINIQNPHVELGSEKLSSSSIILESDNGADRIQFGWIVYPKLYDDQKTHMYTFWKGNNNPGGCYNTQCPGFVHTNNQIPIGYVYPDISEEDHVQFDSFFQVIQVPQVGWELWVMDPREKIGHWPSQLFTTLKESAQQIRFGGQVYTPPSDNTSPPMGSGLFDNEKFNKTCYMRRVYVENRNGLSIIPRDPFVKIVESRCYFTGSNSYIDDPYWYYRFVFGGSGGIAHNTCLG